MTDRMHIDHIMNHGDLARWFTELPNAKVPMPPQRDLIEPVFSPEPGELVMGPVGAKSEGMPLPSTVDSVVTVPATYAWLGSSELEVCRFLATMISVYLAQFPSDEEIVVRVAPQVEGQMDYETGKMVWRARCRIACNPERRKIKRYA